MSRARLPLNLETLNSIDTTDMGIKAALQRQLKGRQSGFLLRTSPGWTWFGSDAVLVVPALVLCCAVGGGHSVSS